MTPIDPIYINGVRFTLVRDGTVSGPIMSMDEAREWAIRYSEHVKVDTSYLAGGGNRMQTLSQKSKLDKIEAMVTELVSKRICRVKFCDNNLCVFCEEGACVRPDILIDKTGSCEDFRLKEIARI